MQRSPFLATSICQGRCKEGTMNLPPLKHCQDRRSGHTYGDSPHFISFHISLGCISIEKWVQRRLGGALFNTVDNECLQINLVVFYTFSAKFFGYSIRQWTKYSQEQYVAPFHAFKNCHHLTNLVQLYGSSFFPQSFSLVLR